MDAPGASPQLENGYTRIANELLEALTRQKLHGREWAVIMVVARHTYGYQRKTHCITGGQIAKMTCISSNHAREVVAGLLAKKILHRIDGCLGLQTDYSLWVNSPLQGASPPHGAPPTRGGKRPPHGAHNKRKKEKRNERDSVFDILEILAEKSRSLQRREDVE